MKFTILGILILLCTGCDHLFEYHPYDLHVSSEYKHINKKNIDRLHTLDDDRDTVRFVLMGDTQRFYDETEDFVSDVNKRGNIDFVIHGGDISDFGMTQEFCWIHDIMKHLNCPYVAIIGNHDHLGLGEEVYDIMYGDVNFSFKFAGVKIVCLNTNALDNDYSVSVPDFTYLKTEIKDTASDYYATFVAMHVPPRNLVFNNNVSDVFQLYIKRFRNLQCCLHAHEHSIEINDLFDDGVMYYGCESMKERSYYVFTVTRSSYEYEIVRF